MRAVNSAAGEEVCELFHECGFSHKFLTSDKDNGDMVVGTKVTHDDGYSETSELSGPVDKSGSKSDLAGRASTYGWLTRLTFRAALGLIIKGECLREEFSAAISPKQVATLAKQLKELGEGEAALLKWAGVDSLDEIPASKFKQATATLKKHLADKQ